jgi:hypothetical protein
MTEMTREEIRRFLGHGTFTGKLALITLTVCYSQFNSKIPNSLFSALAVFLKLKTTKYKYKAYITISADVLSRSTIRGDA